MKDGYVPTIKSNYVDVGKGKELFVVGGHPVREFPFELKRYPSPEISWKLPSGVIFCIFQLSVSPICKVKSHDTILCVTGGTQK